MRLDAHLTPMLPLPAPRVGSMSAFSTKYLGPSVQLVNGDIQESFIRKKSGEMDAWLGGGWEGGWVVG